MPRMSKKRKEEWAFFLNEHNRITYNVLCRKCVHNCKQSFRAIVIECPRYCSKRSGKSGRTQGVTPSPVNGHAAMSSISPAKGSDE